VKIDIPTVLVHLRAKVVREQRSRLDPESLAMRGAAAVFLSQRRFERAGRLARLGRGPLTRIASWAPALSSWTAMRDLPEVPEHTFREWWHKERGR
jgi:L-lactate dehydrogenase complex protein LldF